VYLLVVVGLVSDIKQFVSLIILLQDNIRCQPTLYVSHRSLNLVHVAILLILLYSTELPLQTRQWHYHGAADSRQQINFILFLGVETSAVTGSGTTGHINEKGSHLVDIK